MLRDREQLADLISAENGKSLRRRARRGDLRRRVLPLVRRGGGPHRAASTARRPAGGARTIVTHRPVGVAALVTPWNFPAAMATRKIAPALAAGCTVVLKPAAETPLTALAIARLLAEAGVPDGVVNVVADHRRRRGRRRPGSRTRGSARSPSPGPPVSARCSCTRRRSGCVNSSMELGGNAPFVVTEDADLDAAVAGAMVAKFRNGGQACTAANRFYVHADVADEFVGAVRRRPSSALSVGPAFAGGRDRSADQRRGAVRESGRLVDEAVAAGARISHRAAARGRRATSSPRPCSADVPPDADDPP